MIRSTVVTWRKRQSRNASSRSVSSSPSWYRSQCRFGIAVHRQPRLLDLGALLVGPGPVALEVAGGDRQAAPRQQPQRFVVERRRFECLSHFGQPAGAVRVRLQHGRVLVAQRELEAAVLRALEAAGAAEVGPDRAVLGRCHGRQHVPGMNQLLHDAADPRQHLECATQFVGGDGSDRRAQLVQHQLHPQLAGLVLDDEQHLVMVGRERLLRGQDGVELEIVAVAHAAAEVERGVLGAHDLFGLSRYGHVTACLWLNSGRSHSRCSSTCCRCVTAVQTSAKLVYNGVKPKRRMPPGAGSTPGPAAPPAAAPGSRRSRRVRSGPGRSRRRLARG